MKLNLSENKLTNTQGSEQGFSLVETVIALVTLGVCLAYALPLFLYAKINNSKSEIRTGALIVSQRVFDDIRARKISTLPLSPSTPEIKTATSNSGADRPIITAMGREYESRVTYCQISTDCGSKYRKFKLEVSRNGSKVYDLEANYTELE
ncbi:type II secretion system protein [Chamaesiphon sp. VAR_48_metabat_403]|uniref:type IV pilus modification PilV family protein n=1 Tax=Chamaesiphon sp. VAR_48_metabat_403 TaxID=2964700 RepID=UPI00286E377E|nr:type II secretion system protein [Chamaesiphon sp. VAR_48_metabat_403]